MTTQEEKIQAILAALTASLDENGYVQVAITGAETITLEATSIDLDLTSTDALLTTIDGVLDTIYATLGTYDDTSLLELATALSTALGVKGAGDDALTMLASIETLLADLANIYATLGTPVDAETILSETTAIKEAIGTPVAAETLLTELQAVNANIIAGYRPIETDRIDATAFAAAEDLLVIGTDIMTTLGVGETGWLAITTLDDRICYLLTDDDEHAPSDTTDIPIAADSQILVRATKGDYLSLTGGEVQLTHME